jgi:sugar phosphate isomerase/epimerase
MIGVMQGRLLPKYQGRYQAHPVGYWKDEFNIARKIGLSFIEFILDYNDAEINPLLRDGGIDEILSVCESSGVVTRTVCADYFMEAPLHAYDESVANHSISILNRLLISSEQLGITDIVLPCVDRSRFYSTIVIDRFVKRIREPVALAEKTGVNLSLETDLAPEPYLELLDRFDSDRVTVNYDIGNSAAHGYDPCDELDAYGVRVSDVHIKDRVSNGGSVVLGEGQAEFSLAFGKLREVNYKGPYIMQAYRDEEGLDIFKRQLVWVKRYLLSASQ